MGDVIAALLVWGFLLGMYCLPLCIAVSRDAKHVAGIGVINVLLGWTVLGWIGALTWAVSSPKGGTS